MERQCQLEWESKRCVVVFRLLRSFQYCIICRTQELQMLRNQEQEKLLALKSKNQHLTIELTTVNNRVRELTQSIVDTRVNVADVKSTIDGMRYAIY
jgi:intersectin